MKKLSNILLTIFLITISLTGFFSIWLAIVNPGLPPEYARQYYVVGLIMLFGGLIPYVYLKKQKNN
jgi:hypothetical protein